MLSPDNTFEMLINNVSVKSGSLLEDFSPAVNPEAEIDDPSDSKPATWVDAEEIADPTASKVRLCLSFVVDHIAHSFCD